MAPLNGPIELQDSVRLTRRLGQQVLQVADGHLGGNMAGLLKSENFSQIEAEQVQIASENCAANCGL